MQCDSIHRMIELVLTYVHKTIFKMMRNNGQDVGCISWSFFGVRKKTRAISGDTAYTDEEDKTVM